MKKGKLAMILVLGLFAMVLMGAEDGCSTEEPTVEKGSGKKDGGEEPAEVAGVGDKMTLKGTTYRVVSVETADSVGDEYFSEEANGVFVIVEIEMTNEKDEPATILESNLKLVGGNGKTFSTSTDAMITLGDESFLLLEEIQPDLTVGGKLIYDVPPKATKDSYLLVEDLFSSSTGQINLGL